MDLGSLRTDCIVDTARFHTVVENNYIAADPVNRGPDFILEVSYRKYMSGLQNWTMILWRKFESISDLNQSLFREVSQMKGVFVKIEIQNLNSCMLLIFYIINLLKSLY